MIITNSVYSSESQAKCFKTQEKNFKIEGIKNKKNFYKLSTHINNIPQELYLFCMDEKGKMVCVSDDDSGELELQKNKIIILKSLKFSNRRGTALTINEKPKRTIKLGSCQ